MALDNIMCLVQYEDGSEDVIEVSFDMLDIEGLSVIRYTEPYEFWGQIGYNEVVEVEYDNVNYLFTDYEIIEVLEPEALEDYILEAL